MHTPYSLQQKIQNDLRKLNDFESLIEVSGVYEIKGTIAYPSRQHGTYYYDSLKDNKTKDVITLLVPADLRGLLINGKSYKLRCLTVYQNGNRGSVDFQLGILEVIGEETVINPQRENLIKRKSKILNDFYSEKRRNISILLKEKIKKKELPVIALIYGKNAETLSDIEAALGEFRDKYKFDNNKVNITDEREIIKKLNFLDADKNCDLIAIFRGGGNEGAMEVFENLDLAETVLELDIPVVTAIGHAENEPFIQRISNRSFITPTDFGNYLKETYINSGREDDLSEKESQINAAVARLKLKESQITNEASKISEARHLLEIQRSKVKLSSQEDSRQALETQELLRELESQKRQTKNLKIALAFAAVLFALITSAIIYFLYEPKNVSENKVEPIPVSGNMNGLNSSNSKNNK